MADRRLSQTAVSIFPSRYLAGVEGSRAGSSASESMRETATGPRKVSIISGAEAARPAMNKLVVSVGKC